MHRTFIVGLAAFASIGLASTPAFACAGLIGSNGAVNLGRTTTLAAYHDGETLTGLIADQDGRWVERRSGDDPDALAAELLSLVPA